MSGATILITYNGTDISNSVEFASATFQVMANGSPGSFEFSVRDPNSSLSFTTGKEITLSVDGTLVFGGYVTQVGRTFEFPDKTVGVRKWLLRGVDYNILFDKRILRNTSNYLKQFPMTRKGRMDGDAIKYAIANYADMDGFTTEYVDNVSYYAGDATHVGAYPQQGSLLRELLEPVATRVGAVYYIDAQKRIHFQALETATNAWGFSDAANFSTTYPIHELVIVEDGSIITNDAFVWGGSQWAGSGGTVFARAQNSSSQSIYGHWQSGETHFGEEGYGIQAGVNARANTIVNGPTGADSLNQLKGLKAPQWQMSFSWWLHDVPSVPIAGNLFTIDAAAYGISKVLPLRALSISFPSLDKDGNAYVLMKGDFSLSVTDPWTLWSYIRKNGTRVVNAVVGTTDDDSTSTIYGAYGSFRSSITNVSGLTYKLPFGYIPNTLYVHVNGKVLAPGVGYTETDYVDGTFTLTATPTGVLYVTCRTLAA